MAQEQYGRMLPHSVDEWLAEIFVGMMVITGMVMIATGRYLKEKS